MIIDSPAGLWGFASLIIFILLYLIRPKPQEKIIPSLMFLMKERKKSQKASFLRKFFQNLLFFLQLIALSGLAFSVANPTIDVPYTMSLKNTVIVLDASASMQTKYDTTTRFDKAVDIAKENLAGTASIVLAENNPLTILRDGSKREATLILDKLAAKSTTTNLGAALNTAEEILRGRNGKIILLSDFINTEGSDLLAAKTRIESQGNKVEFIDLGNKADNVGIVDMEVKKDTITVRVKNYKKEEVDIVLELKKGESTITKSEKTTLLPNSIEKFAFPTKSDLSRIELDVKDDLKVDNIAYISMPSKIKVDVLLITNKKENDYIKSALEASKEIELDVAVPPVVPDLEYDVVVIANFDKNLLLPGTFSDLERFVRKGGKVIIVGQEDSHEIDMKGLPPVKFNGIEEQNGKACITNFNQFTKQFDEIPCFTKQNKYLKTEPLEGSLTIATINEYPIISIKELDKGAVVFYGILDDIADFKAQTGYPIFWYQLIKFLVETDDISNYNYKCGDILIEEEQSIKTPSSVLTASKIILDEAGYYEMADRIIAVNLLDEKESDISTEDNDYREEEEIESLSAAQQLVSLNLTVFLVALIFIVLIFEFIVLKRSGQI